jgi:hypothetical protein
MSQASASAEPVPASERWELPEVVAPDGRSEILAKLDRAARQGKLPGFETDPPGDFRVAVFGQPFDRELVARVEERDGGSRIRFSPRLRAKAPAVLLLSVALSLWPGVIFLDALIPASWGWWPTWTWYFPLVIVPTVLAAPGIWRKSETGAAEHAREQIATIARRLGGRVEAVGEAGGSP